MEAHTTARPAEIHSMVDSDHSPDEKVKDLLHSEVTEKKETAQDGEERLAPGTKTIDLLKAERKYDDLKHRVKEDIDYYQAKEHHQHHEDGAITTVALQAQGSTDGKYAELEPEADLLDKLNKRQAEKCHKAMMRGGTIPEDVRIMRATEIF